MEMTAEKSVTCGINRCLPIDKEAKSLQTDGGICTEPQRPERKR